MKAIDISYSRLLVPGDFQLVIQCLWTGWETPAVAAENLSRASRYVAGYIALPAGAATGTPHVEAGMRAAGSHWGRLAFVAIDVELPGITEKAVNEALVAVARNGQRPVIYTSRGTWPLGSNQARLGIPLWDASWGTTPSTGPFPGYAGWTTRVGHQYAGDVNLNGMQVDLNEFDDLWVIARQKALDTAVLLFEEALSLVRQGRRLPDDLVNALRFLLS